MINSFLMNDVNLCEETVRALLGPTFCQSTGSACGTTARQQASRGTEVSLYCCSRQEQPWYCSKPILTGSHTELHFGWQCPQQDWALESTFLFHPPQTAYIPDSCSHCNDTYLKTLGVNMCLHPRGNDSQRGALSELFLVNRQEGLNPLFHSITRTWSLKHKFVFIFHYGTGVQLLSHLWEIV